MTKTLAISALLCAMTAGAFAQTTAPMSSASAPTAHKGKHSAMAASDAASTPMKHKKADKSMKSASSAM